MMENIQFVGVPEGYEAVINEPEERYRVTLIGLASELAEIDVNTLEVYVDVARGSRHRRTRSLRADISECRWR